MAHSNSPDLSVIEFLFAAALERYQTAWDELIEKWFDRDWFRTVNSELDEIRKHAAALPQLSVDVVEIVMRHAQLLRALVKTAGAKHAAQVSTLRSKHSAAIETLRVKCVRFLSPQ